MLRRLSTKKEKSSTSSDVIQKLEEFLACSIWSLPVATFIEGHSIVFDRNHGEAGLQEYQGVFEEYKKLVDTLIECFCGDSNIQLDQLQDALAEVKFSKMSFKHRTLYEPLAAARDFDLFVPMMMRKNVELQLQALQMIEYVCGLLPTVLQIEDGETVKNKKLQTPEETERYLLIAVLRQSKEEWERMNMANSRDEMENMAKAGGEHRQFLEAEMKKEEELMEKAMTQKDEKKTEAESSSSKERPKTSDKSLLNTRRASTPSKSPNRTEPKETSERPKTSKVVPPRTASKDTRRPSLPARPKTQQKTSTSSAVEEDGPKHGPRRKNVKDVHALLQEQKRLNTADVESRREYLQQQRDKLLTLKKQERQKQIEEVSSRVQQERPRTAKAARGSMRTDPNNEDIIAARKAIVSKLKAEIEEK